MNHITTLLVMPFYLNRSHQRTYSLQLLTVKFPNNKGTGQLQF